MAQQGWLQFSVLCKGYFNMQILPKNLEKGFNHDCRRMVAGVVEPRKEVECRKPPIMHRDLNFQNCIIDAVNKARGVMSIDLLEGSVNARVNLTLNLELVCGPDGDWVISRADLQQLVPTRAQLKPTQPATHLEKLSGSKPSGPIQSNNKEWRPKSPLASTVNNSSLWTIPIDQSREASIGTELAHLVEI